MSQKPPAYLDDLPRYTGLTSVCEVGLPVETCAGYLARFAAIKKRLVQISAARMTGTPEWELKAALGRWLWEDATHYRDLETRVGELRTNKSVIDKVLTYQLGDLFTEILHSPGALELCVGLFDVLSPALCEAVKSYLAGTQQLVDQPSVRLLKGLLAEEEERLEVGRQFVRALAQGEDGAARSADWRAHYQSFLEAAGGVLGDMPRPEGLKRPQPRASEEYRISRDFKRDARFQPVLPKHAPEAFAEDPLRTMMWARSQEMTAAEMIASVIYEWDDLPTQAVVDLARHCWDEVRHTLFGQAALEADRFFLTSLPSWVGYAHHTLPAPPPKRYAHLAIATEARAMVHPGGKRGEWEFCRDEANHPLMTTFQDFDWADEVTHVKYGRRWLIDHHCKGDRLAAYKLADETVEERRAYYAQFEQGMESNHGY